MEYKCIIVRYGEIYLKGKNRGFFENTLILTSYDSYFYAKGVKEFLETFNLSLPYLSILGGILTKIFGLENTLVWSSVILSASFGVVLYFLIFAVLEYLGILTKKTNQIFAFLWKYPKYPFSSSCIFDFSFWDYKS